MLSDNIYDLVIETAKSSSSKKQVGAILLNKNRVLCTATNLESKTHPIQAKFAERVGLHQKIYLHAEIAALIKCKEDADTIVVARLGGHNHDELRMAKPCPICALALKEAGIGNIHYTTNNGFFYEYK
jgi:tRNA(Arg) A34 adenosine deaminase TadA